MVTSKKLSDREKLEKLGYGRDRQAPDIFTRFFDDMSIDIQTGELLGRYISEERDTVRRLESCHAALARSASKKPATAKKVATSKKAANARRR